MIRQVCGTDDHRIGIRGDFRYVSGMIPMGVAQKHVVGRLDVLPRGLRIVLFGISLLFSAEVQCVKAAGRCKTLRAGKKRG